MSARLVAARKPLVHLIACLLLCAACGARAQTTRIWTGSGGTDWNTAASWDSDVPGDTENVVIPNTTTKPTMPAGRYPASGTFGSFEVQSGATVTCQGDATVTNEVSGGGVGGDGKIHGIGVTIHCASALIDGTLSANLQGFPSGQGPGTAGTASHGGGPLAYGNVEEPTALGSGSSTIAGGGAIAILATGTITLNGTISANGSVSGNRASSGGSIWLQGQTFAGGSGAQLLARGGGSGTIWIGHGGRISLDYQDRTYSGVVCAAGGGDWSVSQAGSVGGQAGTLWEPNREFPRAGGTVLIDSGSYQYHFPAGSGSFAWDELIVKGRWFELHGDAAITIRSLTMTNNGVFQWDGASVTLGPGDIRLGGTRLAQLVLPAGSYTFNDLDIADKGQLLPVGDIAAENTDSGGTPAKPHGVGITLTCGTVSIASGGSINASLRGFPGGGGSGTAVRGPGGDTLGAGYGGRGSGVTTYGRLSRPTALGSGGHVTDGRGGGAVAVFADTLDLAVDGVIAADAGSSNNGSGAGGSIWIRAGIMTGGGALRARGGSTTTLARYGGGGRIALETGPNSTFDGLIDARGGLLGSAYGGETGSVFRATSAVAGVYGGPNASPVTLAADYEVNRSTAGVKVERTITQWGPRVFAWEDVSRDANGADLANAATYTLLGLEAGKKASVTVNDSPRGTFTVDAEGRLVIEDATMEPAAAVRVELAAGGTLILLR